MVPPEEAELIDRTILGRYSFSWDADGIVAIVMGWGSLINHGAVPNVGLARDLPRRLMGFTCLAPIEAGDELLLDYGLPQAELAEYYGIDRRRTPR